MDHPKDRGSPVDGHYRSLYRQALEEEPVAPWEKDAFDVAEAVLAVVEEGDVCTMVERPGPSDPLTHTLPPALQPLIAQRHWVVWKYELPKGSGNPSKVPYVAAAPSRHASSRNPKDWCSFETAIAAAKKHGFHGVSFALTESATTRFAAFDLDDCRDPKTNTIAEWARRLIGETQSYVEITPSGTGLRIIGYGRADPPVNNKLKAPSGGSCEIYRRTPKFIAVTGDAIDGREFANIDAAIDNHRRTTPQTPEHDGGEDRPADYTTRTGDMPDWIMETVRHGAEVGKRSDEFFKVVRTLKGNGWNAGEIEALLGDHPDGIAAKYWTRLRQEVDRVYYKATTPHGTFTPLPAGELSVAAPFVPKYKNLAAFIREYQPISYTLEGILPSGVFYFLTARRSTGKTAFLVAALFAIILGNDELLGVKVKKGRVAYVALENPTDLRMKLEVARYHFVGAGVTLDDLADRVTIIDAQLPVKEIVEQLKVAAEELGHFQAVLWDTFQAGFQGDEFNDNAGILKYAQQLRTLTGLPGGPSVLVAAHPTKNAGEGELFPYGGGSSINEADGNLTLWAEDGSIKFHQNRVRGPEFEPLHFRIEKLSCPDILDVEGRQILLPVMRPVSAQTAEQRQAAKGSSALDLLKSLAEDPGLSLRERALKLGVPETSMRRSLEELRKGSFVEQGADKKYRLTTKGRKEILTLV
jgi:hypothetical protein